MIVAASLASYVVGAETLPQLREDTRRPPWPGLGGPPSPHRLHTQSASNVAWRAACKHLALA